MKYAVVGDEGIDTPFFDTEQEAIDWWVETTGSDFELTPGYDIQGFIPEEIKEIEAQPEV